MVSVLGRVPSGSKSMFPVATITFLLFLFGIENADAFVSRFLHHRSLTATAQTMQGTESVSLLKATDTSNLVAVTDSNYRELFRGEKYLLLDACAKWCGPCKLIEPLLEQCAKDWDDSVVVGKFDIDSANDENGTSRDLKIELILQGAMPKALPALILVRNNKVLDTWRGVISPEELEEMLEKYVERKQPVGNSKNEALVGEKSKAKNVIDTRETRKFRGIGLMNNFNLF
jgi:thioredoxin 1